VPKNYLSLCKTIHGIREQNADDLTAATTVADEKISMRPDP